MQTDDLEERDPQPGAGLNPSPDADPATLDPDGVYQGGGYDGADLEDVSGQAGTAAAGGVLDVGTGDSSLDDQPDGDRQLTTDSEALDEGLNDSDLGAEQGFTNIHDARGLGPDVTGGQTTSDTTGDRATGIGSGLRE